MTIFFYLTALGVVQLPYVLGTTGAFSAGYEEAKRKRKNYIEPG
jgi:hypothetical protein